MFDVKLTKMLLHRYEEIIKEISSGSTNQYFLLMIFAGKALKLEKVFPTLSSFNPCPSLPSVAMDDRKQF